MIGLLKTASVTSYAAVGGLVAQGHYWWLLGGIPLIAGIHWHLRQQRQQRYGRHRV